MRRLGEIWDGVEKKAAAAKARARAELRARKQYRPKLTPEQLCNPCSYVVDADLAGVRGLALANAAELEQWRMRDELSPTACAIVALLLFFRGLRGGNEGCGLQVSLARWAQVLGKSRRMVCYALDELAARGFISRRRRWVRVEPWEAAPRKGKTSGHVYEKADVIYATYLTRYGAGRLERRGETRALRVITGHGRSRVLSVCGVMARLAAEFGPKIRLIAARVTDAANRCTPTAVTNPNGYLSEQESKGSTPRGDASIPGGTAPPSAAPRLYDWHLRGAASGSYGGGWTPEQLRQFRRRARNLARQDYRRKHPPES